LPSFVILYYKDNDLNVLLSYLSVSFLIGASIFNQGATTFVSEIIFRTANVTSLAKVSLVSLALCASLLYLVHSRYLPAPILSPKVVIIYYFICIANFAMLLITLPSARRRI
jgi:hypothetical protein